jgi:hypothetical protein
LDQVVKYHRRRRATLPNARLHAALHVTVETQLAEGYEPTVATLKRLVAEGLDRHEAIHAIGSVVTEQMFDLLSGAKSSFDHDAYDQALSALSADGWKTSDH